jgi:hypothetical protein
MPYKLMLTTLILMLVPGMLQAQAPEVDPFARAPENDADAEAALLDPFAHPPSGLKVEEAAPGLEGDTIIFKSGSELKGVNIIRDSALFVEVEYLPGEPPVKFPTSQIQEVIRNERSSDSAASADSGIPHPDMVPGEEVSTEFHQALMTVLTEETLELTDQDYLTVLKNFATQTNAALEVDEGVNAIPEGERVFSRSLPAGTTLLNFVQKDFREIAPKIKVVLQYDKLVVHLRDAVTE